MTGAMPRAGVAAWMVLVVCAVAAPAERGVHAQLGLFGSDDEDGGTDGGDAGPYPFLRPRKLVSNPWRADAGPAADATTGVEAAFAPFRKGSYLKDRAPEISALTDDDGGLMSGGDGGKRSFNLDDVEIPSFGADVDAGRKDAGPVVAPDVLLAHARDFATPFTSRSVPEHTAWARLPDTMQSALRALLPDAGPAAWTHDGVGHDLRRAAWKILDADARWKTRSGFLLGAAGAPVPATLVAVGTTRGADGGVRFHGAWVHPRGERAPVGEPILVFAGSRNMGPWRKAAAQKPGLHPRALAKLREKAARVKPPAGAEGPVRVERAEAAVVRTAEGMRVVARVTGMTAGAGAARVCMAVVLGQDGAVLTGGTWSTACGPAPVAAVDADGDGLEELTWRDDSGSLQLRTFPGGDVLVTEAP